MWKRVMLGFHPESGHEFTTVLLSSADDRTVFGRILTYSCRTSNLMHLVVLEPWFSTCISFKVASTET